jgi:hypothetical protein
MRERKTIILLIVVIVETLIICIFFIGKTFYKDDFSFKRNVDVPFPHSFSFIFNKSNDTHGFIAVGNDGNFTSVFLKDKSGRLITVGYDDEHIVSYVILDKKCNYEMETFFMKNSLTDENKIVLSRKEGFGNSKQHYFIDYNNSPFSFSQEIPMGFKGFENDAVEGAQENGNADMTDTEFEGGRQAQ